MFTEEVSYQYLVYGSSAGHLEIDENKWVTTLKDGVPIARDKHTENYNPGSDLSKAQPMTQHLARAIWNPTSVKAVSDEYAAEVEALRAARAAELAEQEAHIAALQAADARITALQGALATAQAALEGVMAVLTAKA